MIIKRNEKKIFPSLNKISTHEQLILWCMSPNNYSKLSNKSITHNKINFDYLRVVSIR